jgi:hypothetical protein
MQKFMCIHTLPANQLTREQLEGMAEAAQHDDHVRGYRSFANLSEGKAICVMESSDRDSLAAWFGKMQVPVDSITAVEFEGDRGHIEEAMREMSSTMGR